jgi:GMP synthase (glutamine-hydrolysing) B subunit
MNSPVAAFRISNIYGVQFHPEVHHTDKGEKILWNFLYKICGCERNWTIESFVRDKIMFINTFEEEAKKLGNADFLAQGTIYPDRIESARARSGDVASRIKSHHNVGALPEKLGLMLIEPINDLYKDEVREVAKELGMPSQILNQHPFPGPGLAARVIGEVTEDKQRICREA